MTFQMVYITTKDAAQAEQLGRILVEKRLAACANIIAGMATIYRWESKIQTGTEAILLLKTQAKHREAILTLVKALHSYDCPCVVFLPLEGGSPAYLKWIEENT